MTTAEFDRQTEDNRRSRVRETASAARSKASDAYSAARERTSAAFSGASERVGRASQRTSEGIDSNPFAALVGGLAIGGLLAAVLPKTKREEEWLGEYGRRINDTARDAARAAREAGASKLDELGYNRENARQKIQSLRTDAAEIARAATQHVKGDAAEVASAAAQNAKGTVQQ